MHVLRRHFHPWNSFSPHYPIYKSYEKPYCFPKTVTSSFLVVIAYSRRQLRTFFLSSSTQSTSTSSNTNPSNAVHKVEEDENEEYDDDNDDETIDYKEERFESGNNSSIIRDSTAGSTDSASSSSNNLGTNLQHTPVMLTSVLSFLNPRAQYDSSPIRQEQRGSKRSHLLEMQKRLQEQEKPQQQKEETNIQQEQWPMQNVSGDHNEFLVVDATFGAGGHSQALLETYPEVKVIALDRDRSALSIAREFEQRFGSHRFTFLSGRFSEQLKVLNRWKNEGILRRIPLVSPRTNQSVHNIPVGVGNGVDAILFDLGVCSRQLADRQRGFSFRKELDGPLDMRMSGSTLDRNQQQQQQQHSVVIGEFSSQNLPAIEDTVEPSAYDIVNTFSESQLTKILSKYGEEKFAKRIARAILEKRSQQPVKTTFELSQIVQNVFTPLQKYTSRIDPATRTFQALRIFVNDELNELKKALPLAEELLLPGGRLVTIAFHSLEDRIIKKFMFFCAKRIQGRAKRPEDDNFLPSFNLISRKVMVPTLEEMNANPRARSAKMRVCVRLNSPPVHQRMPPFENEIDF